MKAKYRLLGLVTGLAVAFAPAVLAQSGPGGGSASGTGASAGSGSETAGSAGSTSSKSRSGTLRGSKAGSGASSGAGGVGRQMTATDCSRAWTSSTGVSRAEFTRQCQVYKGKKS